MKEFNSSGEIVIQDSTIIEPGSPVNKRYVDDVDEALAQRIDSVEWWGGLLGSIDLDTLKTTKTYVQRFLQTAANVEALHYPTRSAGVLSVWETSPTSIIQTYVTQDESWHRRFVSGSWSTWTIPNSGEIDTRIAGSAWQKAAISNVDLNDYTTPGIYPMNLTGGTLNMPVQGPGSLEVYGYALQISQRFTRWNMTVPSTWQRSRNSSGEWSEWHQVQWKGVALGASDSLNTLSDGVYGVNTGSAEGQPSSWSGWVMQVTAGNWKYQFFVTRINEIFTRAGDGTWGEWTPLGGGGVDLQPLQDQIDALAARHAGVPRGEITQGSLVRADTNQARYPAAMSRDRTIYFNGQDSYGQMRYSDDFGATWKNLHKWDGGSYWWTVETDDGELLVRAFDGTNGIWKSSGWPTLRENATWTKTLEVISGIYFSSAWSISVHENIVLVAEYGQKYVPETGYGVPVQSTAKGENARYLYLSLDYGQTWRTVLDINAYAESLPSKATDINLHLHGVAWDPWWDRIWVTAGDGGGAILFSDDLGTTWHTAWDGWAANASGGYGHQSVGIIPMPDCILFATDSSPNGVLRINRSEGKHDGPYTLDVAYTIPEDNGSLSHLAQSAYRVDRSPGDHLAMIAFGTETQAGKGFAVASYDGHEFTRFWQDDQDVAVGRGPRTMIGPTLDGKVIIGSHDQRTSNMWGLWQGEFKGY